MEIDKEVINKLLANYQKPEDIVGENGLLKQLTKALVARAMEAELTTHLGCEKHDPAGYGSANSRNGASKKKLKGDFGEIDMAVPRDRNASFEPQIVPKGQTRFTGFDDKILSLYARGMTTRDIQGHLEEMYGVEVSPTLISHVTEAVLEEVRDWQSRPLDPLAAGPLVSDRVPGCADGEDARQRRSPEPGRLCGLRSNARRAQGSVGSMEFGQ
jgi:putative transposase